MRSTLIGLLRLGTLATIIAASFAAKAQNYSDLWWNPAESGWGLMIADHQTQMFAVWYTYREDNSPTWFVIPGGTFSQGKRIWSGDIYQTSGPPYGAPFDPAQVTVAKVGSATLDFAPPALAAGIALFNYTVGTVSGSKQIQRQPFGDAPPAWGDDLTNIFYDPNEAGWGLTVAQHGNNAFAVWFTYDDQKRPLFVVMPGGTFTATSFTGDLYTTTGPYFGSSTFDPTLVAATKVGSAAIVMDPAATSGIAAPKQASLSCRGFVGCHGKWLPTIGSLLGKWISPQPYGYQAPDTPPPACTIFYNDWTPCDASGNQTRTEHARDPAGCNAASVTTRACTPTQQACTYEYIGGVCQPNGTQSLVVVSQSPPGCHGTPMTSQACVYNNACTTVTYLGWGDCQPNNTQSRLYRASPPGCAYSPVTRACQYVPPANGSPFDGTYDGIYHLDVLVPGFPPTVTNGGVHVVVVNGFASLTVDGSPAGGAALTSDGGLLINATVGGAVGACQYSGTMTHQGGSGPVHCSFPDGGTATGFWQLSRTGA